MSSLASIIAILITLFAILWVAITNDFKLKQASAKYLMAIYAVSIIFVSYVTLM